MKKTVKFFALLCVMLLVGTLLLTACAFFHTHSYGEWEVVKEPTTTEEGKKVRYCECGEKQTEKIEKIKEETSTLTQSQCEEELQDVYDKSVAQKTVFGEAWMNDDSEPTEKTGYYFDGTEYVYYNYHVNTAFDNRKTEEWIGRVGDEYLLFEKTEKAAGNTQTYRVISKEAFYEDIDVEVLFDIVKEIISSMEQSSAFECRKTVGETTVYEIKMTPDGVGSSANITINVEGGLITKCEFGVNDMKAKISYSYDKKITLPDKDEYTDSESTQQPDSGEVKYDGSEVTITFYHTMGEVLRSVLDSYIAEFNKLYPNITVKHQQIGGYDDLREQIKTEITIGDQPNIAYCYPDHVALYNLAQVVQPLDDLIESSQAVIRGDGKAELMGLTRQQIDNFIDGFYEEGRQFADGKFYTLPMSKSTEVLYYNKTFFEQHGLKVPTTWEEMEEVCKRIKEIDPDCIPLGYDSESNWFITMCEQYGSPYTSATGDHFLFDNEQNRAFVTEFRDWYQKGYVTTQDLSGGYTSALFTKNPAEGGNCYMSIGSSAGANYQIPRNDDGSYKFEVGIASIPQVNAENPKVISQGPSLCIFKKSNMQEVYASWLFVKFLTTNLEFQTEFSMVSGYMPVLENATENPVYAWSLQNANGYENLALTALKTALEQSDAYFASPAFYGSSVARDEVGKLMQVCLTSADSNVEAVIKKAFENAVAECRYQTGY